MGQASQDSSGLPASARVGQSRDDKLRVCSFESRQASAMRALIERHGGVATVAPSMQEVALDENREALQFVEALFAGQIDVVVFMTGVGARGLLDVVRTQYPQDQFLSALDRCRIVVRGPKPQAVLKEWNVHIDEYAREPNTWRELLDVLDPTHQTTGENLAEFDDSGTPPSEPLAQETERGGPPTPRGRRVEAVTIAVQEYGQPNPEFYRELEQLGFRVVAVPIYRWELPDDTKPMLEAIRTTTGGGFDVLMFTSANQLKNVLDVAESAGLRDAWLRAARRCVIASIGPTSSAALQSMGLSVDLQPQHPKMGHLVRDTMVAAGQLLLKKQSD